MAKTRAKHWTGVHRAKAWHIPVLERAARRERYPKSHPPKTKREEEQEKNKQNT